MQYRVSLTARAIKDLDNIFQFIQAEQSETAATWFNGLNEALKSLSSLPHRAPATPENPVLRHLLYGSKPNVYRVIYFTDDTKKTVTVLTIRHGARKPIE
ncbi:type II toxin-antitoxin system RelE/ParE family toxin [Granulicella sp. S190]|uniref:type II toxin-antitoxin system RelE/ParE family toxin n=1 Tax=Granulicella sp. S190 TaxID=1747226 RepID=UPI00131B0335|nr:type II toxin-antitoxin system RelE/ParE family toxin [Granulicella sp. S190]